MRYRALSSHVCVGVISAVVAVSSGCSRAGTVEGGLVIPPAHEAQLLVVGDQPTLKATNNGPAMLGVAIEQPNVGQSESALGPGITSYWGVTDGGKVFVRNRTDRDASFSYKVTGSEGFSATLAPLPAK